jgi:hypothetical protein
MLLLIMVGYMLLLIMVGCMLLLIMVGHNGGLHAAARVQHRPTSHVQHITITSKPKQIYISYVCSFFVLPHNTYRPIYYYSSSCMRAYKRGACEVGRQRITWARLRSQLKLSTSYPSASALCGISVRGVQLYSQLFRRWRALACPNPDPSPSPTPPQKGGEKEWGAHGCVFGFQAGVQICST